MSDEEQFKRYFKELEQLKKELSVLENEKAEIIKALNEAATDDRAEIAKKMQKSEEKFKKLCDDVIDLSEKVKKFKQSLPSD